MYTRHLLHSIILFAFLINSACRSNCESHGYHLKLDSTNIITFLSRDGVGGGRAIGIDNLLIDKSIAPLLSIHEYSMIARKYVDTVHCDKLVGCVQFYGVNPCNVEIYPGSLNMDDYALIAFWFHYDNDTKQSGLGRSHLSSIVFWKNGHNKYFEKDGTIVDNGQIIKNARDNRFGQSILDSLESLQIPLKKVRQDIF